MNEENQDLNKKENKAFKENNGSKMKKESLITKLLKGLSDIQGEYKRIVWPTKKNLNKLTVTVIVTSLLVGAIIISMDLVYRTGFEIFVGLLK